MNPFFIGYKDFEKKEIDSDTLVNHVVVLGATGSGKTVLCKNIIEQAVLNRVPILIIDPKGDIGTIGISNKNFDFMPYSDIEARINKQDPVEYADKLKKEYSKKLSKAGITSEIIDAYTNALDLRIYSPKNISGLQISISPKFSPPENFSRDYKENPVEYDELVEGIASSILKICGYKLKKVQKEHALITQIILHEWLNFRDIDIKRLIRLVLNPPFSYIGGLLVPEFLNDKKREDLAGILNLLLSKPSLKYWMEGDTIDFDQFFKKTRNKVRVNIIDLRWINDDFEKQFFLEMLLQNFYRWLIQQPGTNNLKYIFYFDEIKGYLPSHPFNPPSKKFLELLVKQGRAFGLGCILATQNPGDIDYKIIGNIRTRFIGNLKTERDMRKVSEGIDLHFNTLNSIIVRLKQGEFVYNDSLMNKSEVIRSKWLMSYHRGPLQSSEIKKLMNKVKKKLEKEKMKLKGDKPQKFEEEKTRRKKSTKKPTGKSKKKEKQRSRKKVIRTKRKRTCSYCGFTLKSYDKFCGKCGKKSKKSHI